MIGTITEAATPIVTKVFAAPPVLVPIASKETVTKRQTIEIVILTEAKMPIICL